MDGKPSDLAPQIKRKPRGKPFAPGNTQGPRFPPGQSGNPGGRPKSAPEFRQACRLIAADLLAAIKDRIAVDGLVTEDEEGHEHTHRAITPELVKAFETVADRGGFLTGDKLAAAEVARARVYIELLALPLPEEERTKILRRWERHEQDALAAVPDAG